MKRSDQILYSHVSYEEIKLLAHHITGVRKRKHLFMVKRSTIKRQNVFPHVTLPKSRQNLCVTKPSDLQRHHTTPTRLFLIHKRDVTAGCGKMTTRAPLNRKQNCSVAAVVTIFSLMFPFPSNVLKYPPDQRKTSTWCSYFGGGYFLSSPQHSSWIPSAVGQQSPSKAEQPA